MRKRHARKPVLTPYSKFVALFRYQHMQRSWRSRDARQISLREAQRLVAAGDAEPVVRELDGVVQVVGYQALRPIRAERPSPCTLTLGTMLAVAGLREGRGAQREVDKFVVWPWIGDDRAVAVRPRTSEADRKRAQVLLGLAHPHPMARVVINV